MQAQIDTCMPPCLVPQAARVILRELAGTERAVLRPPLNAAPSAVAVECVAGAECRGGSDGIAYHAGELEQGVKTILLLVSRLEMLNTCMHMIKLMPLGPG
jgi:hypothetical protein